jgi:hypothetical protein
VPQLVAKTIKTAADRRVVFMADRYLSILLCEVTYICGAGNYNYRIGI